MSTMGHHPRGGAAMDENVASSSSLLLSKTPSAAGHKQRRAFGDISNRKQPATAAANSINNNNKPAVLFNNNKTAFAEGVAVSTTKKKPAAAASQKKPLFILSDPVATERTTTEQPAAPPPAAKTQSKTTTLAIDNSDLDAADDEPYPEIERPAGRLWSQQQREDLIAFENDNDISDDLWEGADSVQADFAQFQRDRLKAHIEFTLEQDAEHARIAQEEARRVVESDGAWESVLITCVNVSSLCACPSEEWVALCSLY